MSKEGSKIHPSKPFPSKKTGGVQDTPMHLTAKYASAKLFKLLMEYGGHPGTCNARSETCAHSVCLMTSYPFKRAEIIDMVFDWRGQKADNSMDFVDIDTMDVDGNAVLHIAAHNGLLPVVERLVERDANLSLLNHQDLSSCEIAERAQQYDIATMLELAWLFRPTNELQEATQIYHKFASTPGKVVLDGESIKISELIEFINQAIKVTSEALDETAARAEILLNQYCWDVRKLRREYHQQKDKVLSSAKIKARARHGKSSK